MMERRRRDFAFKKKTRNSKPRGRNCGDFACCTIGFACFPMRKYFKAQIIKRWSFKKSSAPAAFQETHRNSSADSSLLSDPAYLQSCSRSRSLSSARNDYQKKQALAMVLATTAAAEAALVAAEAAAHMATLTAPNASRQRW
eukprot:c40999_g1_i1 orf=46-471(+)